MARKGGTGRKKRSLFGKNIKKKGKFSLNNYLASFELGERVNLVLESSIRTGIYNPRFVGKSGVVVAKKGSCYEVKIKDFSKEKLVLVHPVHMKRSNNVAN